MVSVLYTFCQFEVAAPPFFQFRPNISSGPIYGGQGTGKVEISDSALNLAKQIPSEVLQIQHTCICNTSEVLYLP